MSKEMIVRLKQDRVKIKGCEYVQDLIRCGECKKNDTRNCPFYLGGWIHSDDDFCSYAERKGE